MADLLAILENLVSIVPSFSSFLSALCWVIGGIFIISSILQASKRYDYGISQGSWRAPIAKFVIGICFIAFPSVVATMVGTFFGSTDIASAESIFQHAPKMTGIFVDSNSQKIVKDLVIVVKVVGFIGFIRGLYLLNQTAAGNGGSRTYGQGMTFIIASTMAINFPLFVMLMEKLVTAPSTGP